MPAPDYTITEGDICQVTMFAEYQGSQIENVMHYRAKGTGSVATGNNEILALCDKWQTIVNAGAGQQWKPLVVPQYTFNYVQAQIIYPTRRYYNTQTIGIVGTATAPGVPSNCAAVVSFQSHLPGRGRSGSKHFTGFPQANITGAQITSGFQTQLINLADRMIQDQPFDTAGWTWEAILWSTRTLSDTAYIVNKLVHSSVRVMRRRTLYVGI